LLAFSFSGGNVYTCKKLSWFIDVYGIHPTQITRWQHKLAENASDLFGKRKKKEASHETELAELYHQIGKLKGENDFLSHLPGLNLAGRRNNR
jgi:transposase-like protein